MLPVVLTKYHSAVQIKKNEIGGTCNTYGGEEMCIHDLVGKPDGKRIVGRPRHLWEDSIKMGVQGMGWGECTGLIWLKIGPGGGLL